MRIAYVNTWGGFENNGYPEQCFFSRILREIDPSCSIEVGYDPSKSYDLVISMYRPMVGTKSHVDLSKVKEKKLCFTGESYDLVSTTPNADAYIGFDDASEMIGDYKYLRFPLYATYHLNYIDKYGCSSFEELRAKFSREKARKISAVVSNPSNQLRNAVIQTLVMNGFCESGGKVCNSVGDIGDKLDFTSRYLMGLAFENIPKTSYITEKIYEVFAVGSIPFYYGASDISKEFNQDSFIALDTTSDATIINSLNEAISILSNKERIDMMLSADPITGFRSEKYIRNGKEMLKTFIMDVMESK
jgi:hypothetical protein